MASSTIFDLAQHVGVKTDCPRHLALRVVDALFVAMPERPLAGDRGGIRGF